jgi:hypothetical protein
VDGISKWLVRGTFGLFAVLIVGAIVLDRFDSKAEEEKVAKMTDQEKNDYYEEIGARQKAAREQETLIELNRFAHHRDPLQPMDEGEKADWLMRYNLCEAAKRTYDDERATQICEGLRR